MKKRYVLIADLRPIREKKNISLTELAENIFTTSTTLFRIEKRGYTGDRTLAEQLAKTLGYPFDQLFKEVDMSEEAGRKWKENIQKIYHNEMQQGEGYYLFFVTTYQGGEQYTAFSPSYWCRADENDKEIRSLRAYCSRGIKDYLEDAGVAVAVANEVLDTIHFYYGLKDEEEQAILIRCDLLKNRPKYCKKEYTIEPGQMIEKYGIRDCIRSF